MRTLVFTIKESEQEIKALIRKSKPFIARRLVLLLACKRHEQTGISKQALAKACVCGEKTAHTWRQQYIRGGLEGLMSHKKIGYKPSILSKADHALIEEKLRDAENPLHGYVELQNWVKQELANDVDYFTLYQYSRRHFGSKLKVPRKSHIKKDVAAGLTFKKRLQSR